MIAARQAGRKRIGAVVAGTVLDRPGQLYIVAPVMIFVMLCYLLGSNRWLWGEIRRNGVYNFHYRTG